MAARANKEKKDKQWSTNHFTENKRKIEQTTSCATKKKSDERLIRPPHESFTIAIMTCYLVLSSFTTYHIFKMSNSTSVTGGAIAVFFFVAHEDNQKL
jgi:hypothetical protein